MPNSPSDSSNVYQSGDSVSIDKADVYQPDSSLRVLIYKAFDDVRLRVEKDKPANVYSDNADAIMPAVQATLLQVIGTDEKLPLIDVFRDHKVIRNSLRAEQRQRAIELTNTNLKRGITE